MFQNARNVVEISVGRSKGGELPEDIIQASSAALLQQPSIHIPKEETALLSYTSKDREEHQIRFVEVHKVSDLYWQASNSS